MRIQRRKRRMTEQKILTNANSKGTYNGAELAPDYNRPGSLDFQKLPSRIGDERIYQKDDEGWDD